MVNIKLNKNCVNNFIKRLLFFYYYIIIIIIILLYFYYYIFIIVRAIRIELMISIWKIEVIPLNYARFIKFFYSSSYIYLLSFFFLLINIAIKIFNGYCRIRTDDFWQVLIFKMSALNQTRPNTPSFFFFIEFNFISLTLNII